MTTDWVTSKPGIFDKLWELKELQFKFYYYTPEMTRIRAGKYMYLAEDKSATSCLLKLAQDSDVSYDG